MSDPLELAFDVYQRYRLVADVLARLREARGEPLTVLDVGGRTAVLRDFDPEDRIVLVDLEPNEGVGGLVLGDGARLPFADGAFDVVCAFDTLEHVPQELRAAFVAEAERVASRWVVLAGPYDAPRVVEAERLLQRFLREKLRFEHRYLEEHRTNELPDRAAVEAQLAGLGARVTSVGHGNLDRWLALMCLALYLDLDPALRGLARKVFAFYNASLYASDHAEPVYRHAVIAALDGAPLPALDGLLAPPVAPAGALAPFTTLAEELAVFDAERGRWRAERDAFRRSVAELEADLREHRASLDEARGERRKLEEGVAALEDELATLRRESEATIEELEAELDAHRRTFEELRGELQEVRADREALTHRAGELEAIVADRDRRVEREHAEVEARGAEVERLAAELRALGAEREALANRADELADVLADRDADLAAHREVLAARDARVAELEEHAGHLEAHLRDREAELRRWPMAALRRVMWLVFGRPPTVPPKRGG